MSPDDETISLGGFLEGKGISAFGKLLRYLKRAAFVVIRLCEPHCQYEFAVSAKLMKRKQKTTQDPLHVYLVNEASAVLRADIPLR